MDTDQPQRLPAAPEPTPDPPVLVYAPDQPWRLRLYLVPPGPGVEPLAVDVPRGLRLLSAEDHLVCAEQSGFAQVVQTIGDARAWTAVPRKLATSMVERTRDVATLEHLATLEHHPDVRAAVVRQLADVKPARGRRAS